MPKINQLPPSVYNLISAGEVVERPASVVKELIENAVDAGADRIEIEIEGGGLKLIKVSDNGVGIEEEDIALTFLPHATSKLSDAADLDAISTFGFRGEALASISSVSETTIVSKTRKAELAVSQTVRGGQFLPKTMCAGQTGTTVTVRNLFYNTPARLKFLKKPKSEERLAVLKIEELALANPNVSFFLKVDGKRAFSTDGTTLLDAMYAVYGAAYMREMFEFSKKSGNFSIGGFLSKPAFSKPNRSGQVVIINGRVVNSLVVTQAVERAFAQYLVKRSFPMFTLNLTLPFDFLDVNVHPAKSEVRFGDNSAVFGFVFSAVRDELYAQNQIAPWISPEVADKKYADETESIADNTEKNDNNAEIDNSDSAHKGNFANSSGAVKSVASLFSFLKPARAFKDDAASYYLAATADITYSGAHADLDAQKAKEAPQNAGEQTARQNFSNAFNEFSRLSDAENQRREELSQRKQLFSRTSDFENHSETLINSARAQKNQSGGHVWQSEFRIVGQIFDTYIILERETSLYIIDQHAAHERILFDELMKNLQNPFSQPLLIPYKAKLSAQEFEYMETIAPALSRLGFELSFDQESTEMEISALPALISDIKLDEFFGYFLRESGDKKDAELMGEKDISISELLIEKIAKTACKSAIRGGDALSENQIAYILDVFFDKDLNLPKKCPHGRPAVIELSRSDLEKMFKRKL